MISFNPHTHEGCDGNTSIFITIFDYVSIHTPTKGVTIGVWSILRKGSSFNPHTHEGCDLRTSNALCVRSCFNPHTHEGCDLIYSKNG